MISPNEGNNIAPAWKRLGAYLIDVFVINFVIRLVAAGFTISDIVQAWFFFLTFILYNVYMDFFIQGTLGKMILRIKVISAVGGKPTLLQSFNRNFGKVISTLPLFWGFIRIMTPSYKQAIHDELARCFVVKK